MRDFDPTASEFITSGYLKNSRVGGLLYDIGTIISGVSAVGSLLGGESGSNAIQQGTDAQVQANQMGIAEQRRAMEQQRADLAPWAASGGMANNELMRRLGLGGNGRINSFTPKTMEQLRSEMRGQFTGQGAGSVDESMFTDSPDFNFGSGRKPYYRNGDIRPKNDDGSGTYRSIYNPGTYDAESNNTTGNHFESVYVPNSRPQFDEAGLEAAARNTFNSQGAAREGEIDPEYGSLMRKFNQSDLDTDLVYQNGLEYGRKTGENALNQRMAAGGNYGSGAALKALTRFGNDYATTKTEGAYNRNMGEKSSIYGMLSGGSQQGQSAAARQGAAGLSTANNISNLYGNIGNSQAAGGIGQANAMNQGIAGATNALQWNQLINRKPAQSTYNSGNYGMGFDRYLSGNFGSGD